MATSTSLATFATSSTLGDKFPSPASEASLVRSPPSKDGSLPSPTAPSQIKAATSSSAGSVDENVRPLHRGALDATKKSSSRQSLARKRSQYYGGIFSSRAPLTTPRERVARESTIVAELRTNAMLEEELSFMTDLSLQLSQRYQRPESCIFVTVHHSACLLFGGSYEPAYILTISALSCQITPTVNKRNAALLQTFLAEELDIPKSRGIVKFTPIEEQNLATNGVTTLGEVEALEQIRVAENGGPFLRTSSHMRSQQKKVQKTRTWSSTPAPTAPKRLNLLTPPHSKEASAESKSSGSEDKKDMKRRKSFMSFFGR